MGKHVSAGEVNWHATMPLPSKLSWNLSNTSIQGLMKSDASLDAKCLDNELPNLACPITHADERKRYLRFPYAAKVKKNKAIVPEI